MATTQVLLGPLATALEFFSSRRGAPMSGPDMASQAGDAQRHGQDHPAHASFVFLLDETGAVHPLPHVLYVALARKDGGGNADFAGKRFRLADWYVRLRGGLPERVVNEWYGWVSFDSQGRFDPAPDLPQRSPGQPSAPAMDESALPTPEERQRMTAVLFDTTAGSADPAWSR